MIRKRPVPRIHESLVRLGLTAAGAGGVILAYRTREPHMYWLCREIIVAAIRQRHLRAPELFDLIRAGLRPDAGLVYHRLAVIQAALRRPL